MSLQVKNIEYLKEHQPELLRELRPEPQKAMGVEEARRGGLTLSYDGKHVHSPYDPKKEADKVVKGEDARVHVHFGFGLGWFLASDALGPKDICLIFEPESDLLLAAISKIDLAQLCREKNAFIFCRLSRFRKFLELKLKGGEPIKLVESPFHVKHYEQYRSSLHQHLSEARYQSELALRTILETLPAITKSALKALPYTLNEPGVRHLKNIFANIPAVIISPGPSLEGNLPQLGALAKSCLLFAQGRTAQALERQGIKPHFLVHNEYQSYFSLIEQCRNLSDTTFLLSEQAQLPFFQHSHGASFVYGSPVSQLGAWVRGHAPHQEKGFIDTGGSVANDAFSLAVEMGCNPVILVGQDLAVKGEYYYARGEGNLNFQHAESVVRWVPSYFGGQIKTFNNYLAFLIWFKAIAEQLRATKPQLRFINATEGGAHIPGFEQRKLSHLVQELPELEIDIRGIIEQVYEEHKPNGDVDLEKLLILGKRGCQQVIEFNERFQKFAARSKKALGKGLSEGEMLSKLEAYQDEYVSLMAPLTVLNGFLQKDLHEIQEKVVGREHQLEVSRLTFKATAKCAQDLLALFVGIE